MQQALCEWVASAKSEAGVQLKYQQVVLAAFHNRPQKVCQTHGMPCTVQAFKQTNNAYVRKYTKRRWIMITPPNSTHLLVA